MTNPSVNPKTQILDPDIRVLYVTCSSQESALKLATILVSEKLVACANILPNIDSIYLWQNKLEQNKESCLILKIKSSGFDQTCKRIHELHEYEVPCLMELSIHSLNQSYLGWLTNQNSN